MVIMFLTGCLKYAERTFCLYLASPAQLRSDALSRLPQTIEGLEHDKDLPPAEHMKKRLDTMWRGSTSGNVVIRSIMPVDAPLNTAESIFSANELPAMLEKFLSTLGRYQAYEHVGSKSGALLQTPLHEKTNPEAFLSASLLYLCPLETSRFS